MQRYLKQVMFSEGGNVVMASSDHRVAYIFDCSLGIQLDVLWHSGTKSFIQSLAISAFALLNTNY